MQGPQETPSARARLANFMQTPVTAPSLCSVLMASPTLQGEDLEACGMKHPLAASRVHAPAQRYRAIGYTWSSCSMWAGLDSPHTCEVSALTAPATLCITRSDCVRTLVIPVLLLFLMMVLCCDLLRLPLSHHLSRLTCMHAGSQAAGICNTHLPDRCSSCSPCTQPVASSCRSSCSLSHTAG